MDDINKPTQLVYGLAKECLYMYKVSLADPLYPPHTYGSGHIIVFIQNEQLLIIVNVCVSF